MSRAFIASLAACSALASGCGGGSGKVWQCQSTAGTPPDYLTEVGCIADFEALASEPLDASIPGARSGKVVLDQFDDDALYFQNSNKFQIHHDFASEYLSGPDHPLVPSLSEFNANQYTSSDRRFLLGAVTHYEGPDIWALEVAPYDTASPDMITKLYEAVRQRVYFGSKLAFHPTSEAVEAVAKKLPASVAIATTASIFAGIDYQPLNNGEAFGQLRFVKSAEIETAYAGFRDIVVLDSTPDNISVVAGIISEEFQTPLSHINVLARNRGTPNMGLRNAFNDPALRALDGKWVHLVVGSFEYTLTEVTSAEADAWWEAHKPQPRQIPAMDLTVTDLRDVEYVVDNPTVPTKASMQKAITAFGAKTAGYGVLRNTEGVPTRKAFGIPVFYYDQFMRQNGFYDRVNALRADPEFRDKPAVRDAALTQLRADILAAPVDAAFQELLKTKLETDYPGLTMRFRSSTNSEDLDGFPCAGCYDSHTGDPKNWGVDVETCNTDGNKNCSVLQAIRKTWATIWKLRTFEEREYHSIDHTAVGMALLVHHNFVQEEANGVAVTANPFDPSGLVPGLYINVQYGGGAEVVDPPPGITSDAFIYQFTYPGQPIIFISHSNLVLDGTTVLTTAQTYDLGKALDLIHKRFSSAFGPLAGNNGWYAMDVEFKFDDEDSPGETPKLIVKQARPYPGPSR